MLLFTPNPDIVRQRFAKEHESRTYPIPPNCWCSAPREIGSKWFEAIASPARVIVGA